MKIASSAFGLARTALAPARRPLLFGSASWGTFVEAVKSSPAL
nr:hypothetical protein OG999_28815 [Streptomyces sp. NBC_00886]